MWLPLLFGISAAGGDEDLSCKVTAVWREFLIPSLADMVSSWAFLPFSRSSTALSTCFPQSSKFAHSKFFFCSSP